MNAGNRTIEFKMKPSKKKGGPIKYGTYRETINPKTQKLNLVNFICVPSENEFEQMITHITSQIK